MTDHETVRVRLPWRRPPLSANARYGNWQMRARLTADVRAEAAWAIRADGEAMRLTIDPARRERLRVQLGYTPRDRRRRDTDNLTPTLKAVADAVTDLGLAADDDPVHMSKPEPIITGPNRDDPHLWVEISRAEPHEERAPDLIDPRGRAWRQVPLTLDDEEASER